MSGHTLSALHAVRDAALVGPLSADQVELLRTVHGDRYEPLLAERMASTVAPRVAVVVALVARGAPSAPLGDGARPRVLLAELRERLAMAWVAEDALLIVREATKQRNLAARDARRAARQ